MADETAPAPTPSALPAEIASAVEAAIEARVAAVEKAFDARIEGFKKKHLEKPADKPTEKPTLTTEDLTAALRLGSRLTTLPASAREGVEGLIASHGYAHASVVADLIASSLPHDSVRTESIQPARAGIRGVGASPAPSTPAITSLRDFAALQKADPKKARALLAGGLDITALPHG